MDVLDQQWLTVIGLATLGVLGLLIGSFLNVVVWRVPRGESIVSPPSACPACGHAIRAQDNVPVLGWLKLRGRCRDCRAPISPRYPLVEAGTSLLFVLTGLRIGWDPALPAYCYLAAVGVALALIDLDTHRLPDVIVLPSIGVVAVLLTVAAWVGGDWDALLRAGIGGVALFTLYFVLMVVYPPGMGFGDVKLAALVGLATAWIGWGALILGLFAGFLLGGLFGIGVLLVRRSGRGTGIPFGPWMILGAVVGIVVGEQIWTAYLTFIGQF